MAGRDALCRRLGHAFTDPALLEAALTHRSAGRRHNERLEFLGDALLNFVIADALYRRHPECNEGDLSRMRAALVRAESLGEVAAEIGIGDLLVLGAGELKSGGFRRRSTLGDALEALVGAVYLDGGFDAARGAVLALFDSRLDAPPDPATLKDPKTRLQEHLQAAQRPLPVYSLVAESGDAHARRFRVACEVASLGVRADGEGRSRRAAEQDAAAAVLERLQVADG